MMFNIFKKKVIDVYHISRIIGEHGEAGSQTFQVDYAEDGVLKNDMVNASFTYHYSDSSTDKFRFVSSGKRPHKSIIGLIRSLRNTPSGLYEFKKDDFEQVLNRLGL